MQDYTKLKVWEFSHQYVLEIYKVAKVFPKEELFGLVSQLRRAVSSIPANIAEGCGKNTQLDFAKFLNISLGSANEVEYFVLLAKDLDSLKLEVYDTLFNKINQIKAMLINLISKVRT